MTILKVNSNLKHNGEEFPVGKIFEAEQWAFQPLINSGVLTVIEGAESVEQGSEMVAQQVTPPTEAPVEEANQSQDTWGPTRDPIVVPTEDGATGDKTTQGDEQTPTGQTGSNVPAASDKGDNVTGDEL